jgi:hypothetical protein
MEQCSRDGNAYDYCLLAVEATRLIQWYCPSPFVGVPRSPEVPTGTQPWQPPGGGESVDILLGRVAGRLEGRGQDPLGDGEHAAAHRSQADSAAALVADFVPEKAPPP